VDQGARERKRATVVDHAGLRRPEVGMFKYAVVFLIISLIAGAFGLTNVSRIAKRVSMVLFALFFLAFLALMGFAYLVSEAIDRPALAPSPAVTAYA
jgi:uncharacterized membrane protein YtjA (UPF0391 family)